MKDPTTQDTHYIKLSGKANIPEGLEIGFNYEAKIAGTVTTKTESDNNDGSHSIYYKFEPVQVEINKMGKTLKAKDTRGASQIFRAAVWKYWSNKSRTGMESNDYYQRLMTHLIQNVDEICDMYGE